MLTHKEKFFELLRTRLAKGETPGFRLVLAAGSDDRVGRVSLDDDDSMQLSLLQFTYNFGQFSWFPIVLHTTGNANEQPTTYRWHDLEDALEAIAARADEQVKLRL